MSHPLDIHWSRQFPKPSNTTAMNGKTGLSEGSGVPTITKAQWYRGKLYMCGNWQCGLTADVPAKTDPNVYWRLWSWHPDEGYRAIVWTGSTSVGGDGPEGKLSDFLWLPDGRLVVSGGFISLYNRYGHNYFRLHGIAVFDEREPTADRWKPLIPSVQHNAPPGGQILSIAYDPNADELWIVGGFEGFRADPVKGSKCFQPGVQVYSFRTGTYKNMIPGLRGGRGIKVRIDASTNPSTVYLSGAFKIVGGDGEIKGHGGTGWYSTGFCAYRADVGFIPYPSPNKNIIKHEQILSNAADLTYFDQATVHDFLVRKNGEIWIVGSFKEGENSPHPIHAIARWDPVNEVWTDPTGCGGFGRDAYSIEEGPDGKIYIAGSFGGDKGSGPGYPGFINPLGAGGADIHLAVCYDPATNTWEQMGSGLGGFSMPVCRLTVAGPDDVIFYGTFRCVGRQPKKDGAFESNFLARWNPHVDFTKECPPLPDQLAPFNYSAVIPVVDAPTYYGVEHWDRNFRDPERSPMTGKTGLYSGTGAPHVTCLLWVGDILYMGGAWEACNGQRWHVWCYNKEKGYWPIALYRAGKGKEGFCSIPKGMKWHDNRLWLYGASEDFKGIAIYDPATNTWSPLMSHFKDLQIKGNGCTGNPPVEDLQWDPTNGNLYIASPASEKVAEMLGYLPSQVIRITPTGEYFPIGKALCPLTPKHPLSVNCILLDTTKSPTDIYIGGAFAFVHFSTNHKDFAHNVAKWDYATQDWTAFGHGNFWQLSPLDVPNFPNGQPGLPGVPLYGCPTFKEELAGTVRVLMRDKAGVLYAMGCCNILDDNVDVAKRVEEYGIVKFDPAVGVWTGATKEHGVNNDVWQASWLDDTHMLITGSFLYTERYSHLNNVAIFDTQSGELIPVGGGLFKDNDGHVTGQEVVHCLREDGYWFGGNFKFAGCEPKARSQAPVSTAYLAHYDPLHNLDPNGNLRVNPIAPVKGVKGWSSEQRTCELSVSDVPPGGVVTWYNYSSAKWNKCGTGQTYKASFRVKCTDTFFKYAVAVTLPDGTEGSKLYATIPIEPVL